MCHFVTLFVLIALSRHSLVNCNGILVLRGRGAGERENLRSGVLC